MNLSGKKTYILAAIAGLLTVAHALGWITSEVYQTLMGLVGAGGLATLRQGVKKGQGG